MVLRLLIGPVAKVSPERARRNAQQASPSSIPNVPVWAGKTTNSGPDLDGTLEKGEEMV